MATDIHKHQLKEAMQLKNNDLKRVKSFAPEKAPDIDEIMRYKAAALEDKKNVVNLVALNDIEGMNGDVLRVIYNHLIVSVEGHKRYSGIIDTIDNCKNKLERNAQIIEA
jgi:hypothetical protein